MDYSPWMGEKGHKTVTFERGALVDAVVAELLSYFSGARASELSFEEFEARYIAGRIAASLDDDQPAHSSRASKATPRKRKHGPYACQNHR